MIWLSDPFTAASGWRAINSAAGPTSMITPSSCRMAPSSIISGVWRSRTPVTTQRALAIVLVILGLHGA
jgi:hypothetical protein